MFIPKSSPTIISSFPFLSWSEIAIDIELGGLDRWADSGDQTGEKSRMEELYSQSTKNMLFVAAREIFRRRVYQPPTIISPLPSPSGSPVTTASIRLEKSNAGRLDLIVFPPTLSNRAILRAAATTTSFAPSWFKSFPRSIPVIGPESFGRKSVSVSDRRNWLGPAAGSGLKTYTIG